MTFRVGQKVVCVDVETRDGRSWYGDAPTLNAVYTVAATGFLMGPDPTETPALSLVELTRHPAVTCFYGFDGYAADRFRPIVTTDISIFTQMPAPSRRKETVQ